jgi:hypothetical protein
MKPTIRHIGCTVVAFTLVACARKQADPSPTPAGGPAGPPTGSHAATYEQVMTEVNEGEESYIRMALAAAGYLRHIAPGKVIGFLQPDLKGPAFRDMVDEVTRTYAYRPIRSSEYRVVCQPPSNTPGTVTAAKPTCSMYLVDVVAQFEVTRMTLDSGWVGGSTTQVPRGGVAAEEKAFCIALARQGQGWKAVRSTPIDDRRRCPR